MFSAVDQENVERASQTANFLVSHLQDIVKSTNPLLSDIAIEILQQALQIEQRLKRIEVIAHTGEDSV